MSTTSYSIGIDLGTTFTAAAVYRDGAANAFLLVETWLSWLSTAMCDVVEGGDAHATLARTLLLARREGYDAEADCVLVLAYWAICAGRYDEAAELVGTAVQGRFNTTAHYVLYRAVIDPPLRRHLDTGALAAAVARGRSRTPAAALAEVV